MKERVAVEGVRQAYDKRVEQYAGAGMEWVNDENYKDRLLPPTSVELLARDLRVRQKRHENRKAVLYSVLFWLCGVLVYFEHDSIKEGATVQFAFRKVCTA